MTDIGPDWIPDQDGIPSRRAARVIIFDAQGKVLLIRGHDTHDLDHTWWFTVGGGLEPGEAARLGAVRETLEETGLRLDPQELVGPVIHRKGEFRFANATVRQDEDFFLAYLQHSQPKITPKGLTAMENQTLDEFAWLTPQQVQELSLTQAVYPEALPALLEQWRGGWDGRFVELGWDQKPSDAGHVESDKQSRF